MIVAASTPHGHAEERPANLDELGVDVIRLHLGFIGINNLEVPDHQETRGDEL